jgi:hypothetical protein
MSKILKFNDFVNESYDNTETVSIDEKKDSAPKKPAKYKNFKDEDFVFANGGKVDGWHFPINTKARAKNALARANQFDSAPEWYSGSLKSLVTKVANAVKKKYPDIEVTEKSKKPGKG